MGGGVGFTSWLFYQLSYCPCPNSNTLLHLFRYHPGYSYPIAYPGGPPPPPQFMGPIAPPQLIMAPNGSIRSVQSVPLLTAAPLSHTWDGEPCPVHHQVYIFSNLGNCCDSSKKSRKNWKIPSSVFFVTYFFLTLFVNVHNKLECLSLASLSSQV